MLSRQLAVEFADRGIRSSVACPDMIEPRTVHDQGNLSSPAVRAKREALVPNRRIAQPEDVANAVVFLARHRNDYINDEDIVVDGGSTRTTVSQIPRLGLEQTDAALSSRKNLLHR